MGTPSSTSAPAAPAAEATAAPVAAAAATMTTTPAASAPASGASTPVIGAMGLAPITAGRSRKKKKKGRKVGFGRNAALQEMQASEAEGQRTATSDSGGAGVGSAASANASGGSSMLAGLNIRKKAAPSAAAPATAAASTMSDQERKFQEDLQRAMAASMQDAEPAATADAEPAATADAEPAATADAAATAAAAYSDDNMSARASLPQMPQPIANNTDATAPARRPSISGTSLLPSPDALGISGRSFSTNNNGAPASSSSASNNNINNNAEPATLPSTLNAFAASATMFKDQVAAFGARKASLRERKRALEGAALHLSGKVAAAEAEVLSAIESEDFEKAESCQVTMGNAKAQQSRNESELRDVASAVNGLRAEQLSLFEEHISSVSGLVEDVGRVKGALEASLRETSSASTDHVERERRRLTLVVQKLDLEREHLELDTQGVKEDRAVMESERSQEKSAAEKELGDLGVARLSVESDLEALRRQVVEKEQELAELNAKAESATAVVQEVSQRYNTYRVSSLVVVVGGGVLRFFCLLCPSCG
jgi:hypothetical protein